MTLSIIEQFEISCEVCEGDIVCPHCGVEIGQFYHWAKAADHIEHDRCPICSCEEDNGTYEWCEHCTNRCEAREELEEQAAYERHVEFQFKCRREERLMAAYA